MKISEINIQLIKPANGLVAFASVVLDDKVYLDPSVCINGLMAPVTG